MSGYGICLFFSLIICPTALTIGAQQAKNDDLHGRLSYLMLATLLSADVVVVELKCSSRVLWVVHTWGVENNNIIIKRAANYLIAAETT